MEVLGEVHETVETGFERRGVAAKLGAEGAVALLLPEPVLGAGADEFEAVLFACRHELIPEVGLHLDRVVKLPAKLARIGDTDGHGRAHAKLDVAHGEPGETLVGEDG